MGNKQRTVSQNEKTTQVAATFGKERWACIWHGNMALALPQRGRLGHLVMSTDNIDRCVRGRGACVQSRLKRFSRFSHSSAPSGPLQPHASACHAGRAGGEPVERGVGTERAEVRGRPSPPNPSPCLPATRPRWAVARQRRNSSARAASRARNRARNRGRSRPRHRSRPAAPTSTSSPSPGRILAPGVTRGLGAAGIQAPR